MAHVTRLTPAEIDAGLAGLDGWAVKAGKLHREFRFADFVEAFSFMSAMALVSEKLDHHPEWFNVYSRVVVDLTTHDAGGISEKDLAWAKRADGIASRDSGPRR